VIASDVTGASGSVTGALCSVTGALHIVATHDGERTRIARLRQEGLSRCSRPLPAPGGAAKLVIAQLGPGFVRGDRYELAVTLGDRAGLVLEMQSAARAFGGGSASSSVQRIDVGCDARLVFAGEPLVAYDGAVHRSQTHVRLADGASLAWVDCIAPHGAFTSVTTALRIVIAGRLAVHDVLRLTPGRLDGHAFGSAYYLRAGMSEKRSEQLVAIADATSPNASATTTRHATNDVAIGVGSPMSGGVILRASSLRVTDVRRALIDVLDTIRSHDAEGDLLAREPDRFRKRSTTPTTPGR
jgi:urease accessory protein UreH